MKNEESIDLADLFPRADRGDQAWEWFHFEGLQLEAAAKIAARLGLTFIPDPLTDSSDVCQANAEGVQPVYRTAVTAREVFYYLAAILEDGAAGRTTIPYPSGPEAFWQLVARGAQLRRGE